MRPEDLDALAAASMALSRLLLASPDAATLARLHAAAEQGDWPLLGSATAQRGLALLARSAEAGETAEVVHRDHNRLFVGPEAPLAPPYESVHRSEEGLLFEAETLQVRAFYARFGLQVPRLGREPDDHIGLELELVASLCLGALDALEADDEARAQALLEGLRTFLDQHLLAWAPTLLTQVAQGARTWFHAGLAELGRALLEELGPLRASTRPAQA